MGNLDEKLMLLEINVKRLIAENTKLHQALEQMKEKHNQLEEQYQQLVASGESRVNTSNHKSDVRHTEQLKSQLNQYIKEIDQCIEWLQEN